MSTGFVLNIPDTMLEKLKETDKHISSLAEKSNEAQKGVVAAFKSMADNGVGYFIEKLKEAGGLIDSVGTMSKNLDFGKNISQSATKAIDDVVELVKSIEKIQTVDQKRTNSAITQINLEIEEAIKRLGVLRERLNFYAIGEGQKTIGFVDTSAYEDEAESLMKTITLLEEKRRLLIEESKVRLSAAMKQEEIDNAWFAMERQRDARIKQNAAFASEQAKQSSKAYEEAYEEQLRAYEKLWDKAEKIASDKDTKIYENWLRQKDREKRESEKAENEKFKAQQKAAMEAFKAEQERLDKLAQIRRQNEAAKTSGEEAKWGYEHTISMYAQMFDEIERNRKESIDRQNANEFAEYQSLLARIKQLQKEQGEAKAILDAPAGSLGESETEQRNLATKQYRGIEEELEKSLRRREALEKKHGDSLESIRRQSYSSDIRDMQKAEEDKRRVLEETLRKQRSTYEGSLDFSRNADSVVKMTQAVRFLEAARDELSTTDVNYTQKVKALNDEIKRQNAEINKVRSGAKELQKEHRSLMDISGQLARRLALVFSVSQITGYVKKLIEVRGEFELQQRSLQAILQNKDEANRIWQQTVDLAVRSPFRVKELVSYTKQLAAYRIESDKLFETNKMLADISAGLGVDMQRLILAFGQVRSAAYLRGTELRQFTEAGIPILEQLAQYFTELEGRAVSVGDVFERVSKRMVSFADVEEIFKRMTSEGGTFYRMQEIQAETLQGQISNLKDSVDIMLNEIGKAHQDTLKSSVAFVRSIVQNWRLLATAIQQAGFALAGFSAVKIIRALRLTGDALVEATVKTKGLTAATAKLKLAMMDLGKWVKANPYLLAAGLVASAAHALVQYGKSVDAMNEKYDEMSQRELRRVDTLKQLNEQVEKNNQAIKDAIAEQDNASEGTDEYATAEENLSRARGKNISLLERLKKEYPEVYASITKQEDGTVDLTKAIEEQNRVAQRQIALQQQAKGGWFQESLTKNYEDAVEALGNYQSSLDEVAIATYEMRQNLSMALSSGQITQEEYDAISSIADRMMDIKDSVEGLNLIKEIFGTKAMSNAEISALVEPIRHALVELGETVPEYNWALGDFFDNLENLKSLPVTINEMVALDPEKGKENAGDYVESVLDEFGIVNDTIREWAKRKVEKIIGFKLVWGNDEGGGGDDELDGWAKRVKEAVDALNEEIKKKSPEIDADALFPVPNKNQTREEYLAVAKDAIGVAEMTYDELQKIEDQEAVDRTKALSPFVETYRKILNIYKETTKDDGDKDTFTPMLRTVKEIYQEFKKLQGSFDDLTAKEGALAKFGDAFKEAFGKTPEQMGFDLFSEEGVKAAYDYLISKAPDAKKKIQAQLAKGEIVWDVKLQTKKGADKELMDGIQELFDQYDLSLELKKLNIPPDLAKSLFNVDYLDLDGLKKAVEEQKDAFVGKGMLAEYDDLMKKIGELSRKRQEEEAKEFINFLKKNLDEIKLIQDKGAYNIALADRLFGEGKISAEQYMLSIRQIVEDTNKEVAKVNLDKFKDSATYIKAMGNLAAYSRDELEGMIGALQGQVGANAGNMGADEIRAYYEALERLVDQYDKIESPFQKGEINDLIEYLNLQKQLNQEKEKEAALEQRKAELNTRLMLLQNKLASQQASGDTEGAKFTQGLIKNAVNELKEVDGELVSVTSNISVISEKVANLGDGMIKSLVVAQKVVNEIANIANASTKMFDDIKSAADALGADTESGGWAKAGYAMEMVGGVSSELTSGLASLASGDFAGALASVVGMVTKLISGFAKIHDQDYQDIIEAQAEEVERLGRAYEKLETATESAYSIQQLQQYNEELERNVELQIASYKAMIAAEQAKKNTDEEQIAAWNEELEALTQQWEELKQSLVEGLGGVSDYRSQTREFVDSWVSAFQETGDGLSGLKENFREFFDNIIAEQAALRVTEKFLEPFYESLNTALKDYELTAKESKDLREMVEKIAPDLSSALEKIWGELGGSRGEAQGSGLSALQKGIQGITSDQAEILSAYWNSVRGYTASIDSKMDLILANMGVGAENNPMLEQLKSQTGYLMTIKDVLSGASSFESRAIWVRLAEQK